MSYRIVFKGDLPDEYVDEGTGRKMADAWEQGTLSGRVSVNGNLYEVSAIKAIMSGFANPDTSSRHQTNTDEVRKIWDDFNQDKNRRLALTPEKRAQETGLAEMLFGAYKTTFPREEVIKLQQKFFETHPNFAQAKPTIYKHLLKTPIMGRGKETAVHVADLTVMAALSLAEKVVADGIGG